MLRLDDYLLLFRESMHIAMIINETRFD